MVELSVIIPSYRAPQLLLQALVSLAQDDGFGGTAELIVVDDGSPDYDADFFSEVGGPWPLQLVHFDENRGRAAARNEGLRQATGEIVVFLDGDMTVKEGFLQSHAAFHQQHNDAMAVGDIRFAPDIRVDAMTRYIHSRGVSRYRAGQVPFKCFVTGNSSVPRNALSSVGGFDEAFVTYGGEDLELGYRLHLQGLSVYYLPQAASLHHEVRSFSGMCEAMIAYGRDSVPLILSRHPSLDQVLRLDFVRHPWWHPRRMILQLALCRSVRAAITVAARCLMGWRLPGIVFDYLWWSYRTWGYLTRSSSRQNKTGP